MNLEQRRFALRKDILELVYRAKTGHIGGDYSVCDILTILYYRHMNITPENFGTPQRDHFILSKGHSVEALYSVLADKGFFDKKQLETFSQFGSPFIGHPNNKIPGIEMCSGSLGHGLSVACGMALAERMNKSDHRVYVVMGDGELAEGSVWEGAMFAGHFGLDHLVVLVDRNHLQISGSTEMVMNPKDEESLWRGFGFQVLRADGNNLNSLDEALTLAKQTSGKPTVILAETVKGYGVSFMENRAEWHHKVPTEAEFTCAQKELTERMVAARE